MLYKRLLTLMFFSKMAPPQPHDGRPIGTETTQERPHSPSFVEDVFVNAVETIAKNIFRQILVSSIFFLFLHEQICDFCWS